MSDDKSTGGLDILLDAAAADAADRSGGAGNLSAPGANRGGRPSQYSVELCDEICDRIAGGESLQDICKEERYPARTTVQGWLRKHHEFAREYAIARACLVEDVCDEILQIADDSSGDYKLSGPADAPVMQIVPDAVKRSALCCKERWTWLVWHHFRVDMHPFCRKRVRRCAPARWMSAGRLMKPNFSART
jgi:hypothetical protein